VVAIAGPVRPLSAIVGQGDRCDRSAVGLR